MSSPCRRATELAERLWCRRGTVIFFWTERVRVRCAQSGARHTSPACRRGRRVFIVSCEIIQTRSITRPGARPMPHSTLTHRRPKAPSKNAHRALKKHITHRRTARDHTRPSLRSVLSVSPTPVPIPISCGLESEPHRNGRMPVRLSSLALSGDDRR